MSKELIVLDRHKVTEFYGGEKRGDMLQITAQNVTLPDGELTPIKMLQIEGFIQLTEKEALGLSIAIDNWLSMQGEKYEV